MRIMGLDVGDKIIGIAISDSMLMTAQGKKSLQNSSFEAVARQLRTLAEEYEVHQIVIGNPMHMNGKASRQGDKVMRFGGKLAKALDLPVVFWDERLTSKEAERVLKQSGISIEKRAKAIDRLAAVILLASYLDAGGTA